MCRPRRRLHLGEAQVTFCLLQDRKREAILSRRTLTDRLWAIIEPLVPGKRGHRGRSGADNRWFGDAVLWLARGATLWRDVPPERGTWRTVHSRFRRWTLAGVWDSLFKTLKRYAKNLNHLTLPEIKDFNALGGFGWPPRSAPNKRRWPTSGSSKRYDVLRPVLPNAARPRRLQQTCAWHPRRQNAIGSKHDLQR